MVLGRLAFCGIHAGGGSVCARNWKSCRAGVLLQHCSGGRCSGTVPRRMGDTGTPRLLRDSRRWRFSVCSQRGKLSGWVAVATLEWWTLLLNRAWVNGGYWDATPPAGFTQVAVRCVLATVKAVGLGCCCNTGMVDVAPEPCLGEWGLLGRHASCGIHAGGGSVCARNGESCRAGVLLQHWNGGRCSGTVPG
jgi:hypothetical protein